jgi:hypothetical protein
MHYGEKLLGMQEGEFSALYAAHAHPQRRLPSHPPNPLPPPPRIRRQAMQRMPPCDAKPDVDEREDEWSISARCLFFCADCGCVFSGFNEPWDLEPGGVQPCIDAPSILERSRRGSGCRFLAAPPSHGRCVVFFVVALSLPDGAAPLRPQEKVELKVPVFDTGSKGAVVTGTPQLEWEMTEVYTPPTKVSRGRRSVLYARPVADSAAHGGDGSRSRPFPSLAAALAVAARPHCVASSAPATSGDFRAWLPHLSTFLVT